MGFFNYTSEEKRISLLILKIIIKKNAVQFLYLWIKKKSNF